MEAFLVGLNHALARELAWRRYPIGPRPARCSARFWAAATAAARPRRSPEIAAWPAGCELGSHSPGADQLVLLFRGGLFRRFPTAAVYLAGTQADGTERHLAHHRGLVGPGTAFFGFPLTPGQVLHPDQGPPRRSARGPVVIQEAVDHVRFGCDDASGADPGATPGTWRDLDWSNSHFGGLPFSPVAGRPG